MQVNDADKQPLARTPLGALAAGALANAAGGTLLSFAWVGRAA